MVVNIRIRYILFNSLSRRWAACKGSWQSSRWSPGPLQILLNLQPVQKSLLDLPGCNAKYLWDLKSNAGDDKIINNEKSTEEGRVMHEHLRNNDLGKFISAQFTSDRMKVVDIGSHFDAFQKHQLMNTSMCQGRGLVCLPQMKRKRTTEQKRMHRMLSNRIQFGTYLKEMEANEKHLMRSSCSSHRSLTDYSVSTSKLFGGR